MILYVNMLQNLYAKRKVSSMKWHQGLRIDRCWAYKGPHQFQAPLAT